MLDLTTELEMNWIKRVQNGNKLLHFMQSFEGKKVVENERDCVGRKQKRYDTRHNRDIYIHLDVDRYVDLYMYI